MNATPVHVLNHHVHRSNLIESIRANPGSSYYNDHMTAAQSVANNDRFIHPNEIHKILMGRDDLIAGEAGRYRTCEVYVVHSGVEKPFPRSEMVPSLMNEWERLVDLFLASENDADTEKICRALHAHFLCIHPYRDGNGRTSRLVWNNLRLLKGIPWHVVSAREVRNYYQEIIDVENTFFKPAYPNVY